MGARIKLVKYSKVSVSKQRQIREKSFTMLNKKYLLTYFQSLFFHPSFTSIRKCKDLNLTFLFVTLMIMLSIFLFWYAIFEKSVLYFDFILNHLCHRRSQMHV